MLPDTIRKNTKLRKISKLINIRISSEKENLYDLDFVLTKYRKIGISLQTFPEIPASSIRLGRYRGKF